MPSSRLRQEQVHTEGAGIDDTLDPTQHDANAVDLADTISYICSQLRKITGESRWEDPPKSSLASAPLYLPFSAATAAGAYSLGVLPAGSIVSEIAVLVSVAFDGEISVEVGPAAAPAELFEATDGNLALAGAYKVDADRRYAAATELFLNVLKPGALPTVGAGFVVVYVG